MVWISSTRSVSWTLVVLAAVLLSGVTSGLHAGGDAVGKPSIEPKTIYYSQHSGESTEEHLHAETGFESVICLACSLSLRNQTVLEAAPTLVASSPVGERPPSGFSSAPLETQSRTSPSRAPPRV